jgi:hypothetical protein
MLSVSLRIRLANVLAIAFRNEIAAEQLVVKAEVQKTFAQITTPSAKHQKKKMREVVDYFIDNWQLRSLIQAARNERPQHRVLLNILEEAERAAERADQEANWQRLCTKGLVIKGGPFVNRQNLRKILEGVEVVSRKMLRITGSPEVFGKSWSRQLIESIDRFDEPPLVIDLRVEQNPEARSSPSWLAGKLAGLLPKTRATTATTQAENRLVEWLVGRWPKEPLEPRRCVLIDHTRVAAGSVQEYVRALALAVVQGHLEGLWLVLIDPPDLDLGEYKERSSEDIVEPLTPEKIHEFLTQAEWVVSQRNGVYTEDLYKQILARVSWPLTRDAVLPLRANLLAALETITYSHRTVA